MILWGIWTTPSLLLLPSRTVRQFKCIQTNAWCEVEFFWVTWQYLKTFYCADKWAVLFQILPANYLLKHHVHTCFVIDRQTVSLYYNSSVWLGTRDASSWDRTPTEVKSARYLTPWLSPFQRRWKKFYVWIYLNKRLWVPKECVCGNR